MDGGIMVYPAAADRVKPALWRKFAATVLDFVTVFFGGGLIIASLTGGLTPTTTETGTQIAFSLSGLPALILFVVIIAYYAVSYKSAGGTIWQRILRAR